MFSNESFGQTNNDCDSIYSFVEIMPEYENGTKGLMDYLSKDLIPILTDCTQSDSTLIASLYLTMTIDKRKSY